MPKSREEIDDIMETLVPELLDGQNTDGALYVASVLMGAGYATFKQVGVRDDNIVAAVASTSALMSVIRSNPMAES